MGKSLVHPTDVHAALPTRGATVVHAHSLAQQTLAVCHLHARLCSGALGREAHPPGASLPGMVPPGTAVRKNHTLSGFEERKCITLRF